MSKITSIRLGQDTSDKIEKLKKLFPYASTTQIIKIAIDELYGHPVEDITECPRCNATGASIDLLIREKKYKCHECLIEWDC